MKKIFIIPSSIVSSIFLLIGCLQNENSDTQDISYSSELGKSSVEYSSEHSPELMSSSSIQMNAPLSSSKEAVSPSSSMESILSSPPQTISSSSVDASVSSSLTASLSIESGTFIDERDNQEYRWTKIGDQIWMGGNLNYRTDEGSICYNDSLHNCGVFGRLYTWSAAMNNETESDRNPSGVRGLCPVNWHIPSEAEWEQFLILIDDISSGGAKLKTKDLWAKRPGTNEFKFYASPAGHRIPDGLFEGVNYATAWWSTRKDDDNSSMVFGLHTLDNDFAWGHAEQGIFYSVRCLKND